MQEARLVLIGLGNLGRRFCELLLQKEQTLAERYGLQIKLVGAADSRGAAWEAAGLDPAQIIALKQVGGTVGDYPGVGRLGCPAGEMMDAVDADLLLEASPVNLAAGGEPGLSNIRSALRRGWHVVTPNKGPMVLAYDELTSLAYEQGVELRYDGTVAGGLPAVNLGRRDLAGAEVHRIEAVPNLVTGMVLDALAAGTSLEEAKAAARAAGTLEADASWDLEGWDAAAKLVILVNATMRPQPAVTLAEVARRGIDATPVAELRRARQQGERYRLLARAERRQDGSLTLTVEPTLLPAEHPLDRLGSMEMGVVYYSDIYGRITAMIQEETPMPSAATMLRDLLDIYRRR